MSSQRRVGVVGVFLALGLAVSWLGLWLQRNPSWNWQTLTYPQFDRLFAQSVAGVLATVPRSAKTGAFWEKWEK